MYEIEEMIIRYDNLNKARMEYIEAKLETMRVMLEIILEELKGENNVNNK